MKFIYFYILALSILAPFVLANYQYTNYGMAGYTFGVDSLPQPLWSSNQYAGSLPVSANFNNIAMDRLPIIINPHDSFSATSSNYIFMFDAGTMYAADNLFNTISSLPLAGDTGGLDVIPYPTSSSPLMFAGLFNYGGSNEIRLYNFTDDSFGLAKEIFITNRTYQGEVYAGKLQVVYVPDVSNNFTRVDLRTGSSIFFDAPIQGMTSCTTQEAPNYGNNFLVDDFNNDGYDDILQIGAITTNKVMVSLYNMHTGTYFFRINISSGTDNAYCSVMAGTIGSTGASKKIITYIHGSAGHINEAEMHVLDLNGNNLLGAQIGGVETDYPVIADINLDGQNELITPSNGNVYNSNMVLIATIDTGDNPFGTLRTPQTDARIMGFGKFSNATNLDIVTAKGIYAPNQTALPGSRWQQKFLFASNPVYNSTLTNDASGIIIADVANKNSKDILWMTENGNSVLYSSSFGGNVCGDGICGFGETQLTCPLDCSPASPSDAVLTSVQIDPCNTITWLKNTSVRVQATAQSTGTEPITISADFCKDCFTSCEQTASQVVANGGAATFIFKANCTGTDMDLEVTADKPDQVSPDILSFPYSVDASSGSVFGDSSCGVNQPLNPAAAGNLSGNPNNGITDGLSSLSALTGLSGIILWLISMAVITLAIIFGCAYAKFPAVIMMGLVILTDILLTAIGAFLKVLPVSFIIIIALGLVVVIGLWFRGQVTGQGTG